MNRLVFLIGASGSGKTTIANALDSILTNFKILHFDSIGVPHFKKMIEEYGSVDEWQRAKTIEWTKQIKLNHLNKNHIILDAQTRPSFIEEACKTTNLRNYLVILLDCNDAVREQRLIARGSFELANNTMMNWANYLRKESISRNIQILDTSELSVGQSISLLTEMIENKK